jgi:hypothetical protein
MQLRSLLIISLIAVISFSSNAKAGFVEQWVACKKLDDDKQRLNCYDNLALDKKFAKKTAKEKVIDNFGIEHKTALQNAQDKLTGVVAKVKKSPYGKLKIYLENGQQWDQVDRGKLKVTIGDKVEIERGSLGAFFLVKKGSDRRIKVKRKD